MSEPTTIPSIHADAARVTVTPHTVHLELAMSRPDGTHVPTAHLALPAALAAELAILLARSLQECQKLRDANAVVAP